MFRLVLFGCMVNAFSIENIDLSIDKDRYRDVNTREGVVRGFMVEEEDYQYFAFKGIPYAEPPIGSLRFKPPLPVRPRNDIYVANREVQCPQDGEGEEDCLVLNIFTPLEILNGPLPVVVYIHGGSFVMGFSQTDGIGPLIEENVIVVTVNYRLGALGFLCLGVKDAPGNVGLKDQVAALKWVKRNIEEFGGDPEKVTLYGMSAGAASVEYHVLSPMSTGLFQQAIIESGAATPVWAIDHEPVNTILEFADSLNLPRCTANNCEKYFKTLLRILKKIPAKTLSKSNMEYYNTLTDGRFGFVPCVERTKEAFLNKSPYEILTKGLYKKVPLMAIFTTAEGLFLRSVEYHEQNWKDKMSKNFTNFLPCDLKFDSTETRNKVSKKIWAFYFGNNDTIEDENILQYLNYFGDHLVVQALVNSALFHARGSNPVYLMEFAYKGHLGSYEEFYSNIDLAGHGDAVKHVLLKKTPENGNDELTVKRMSKLLGNFVKFGNPTPEKTDLLPIEWPKVNPNNIRYLRLNKDFQIKKEPRLYQRTFWDQLYYKYRRDAKPVDPGF